MHDFDCVAIDELRARVHRTRDDVVVPFHGDRNKIEPHRDQEVTHGRTIREVAMLAIYGNTHAPRG